MYTVPGWGVTKPSCSVSLFSRFSPLSKHWKLFEYHVHIWQVSSQLWCDGTCHIWMWFKASNMYFRKTDNLLNGEINEPSFSYPQPCGIYHTVSHLWRSSRHSRLPHGREYWDRTAHTSGRPVCVLYSMLVPSTFGHLRVRVFRFTSFMLSPCNYQVRITINRYSTISPSFFFVS